MQFTGYRWWASHGWFPRGTAPSWFWKGITIAVASGAGTLTPSPIAATFTVTTPTVARGTRTLTPSPVAAALTATTPTVVRGTRTVTPSPITATFATTTPSVVRGMRTLTTSPVATAFTVATPAVLRGTRTLAPASVVAVFSATTPAVGGSAPTLTPSTVTANFAVAAPVIVRGARTLTPSSVTATFSVGAPTTVRGARILAPSPAVAAFAATTPSVVRGTRTIIPSPVAAMFTATAPAILRGTRTLTPSAVSATLAATTPTVIHGVLPTVLGELVAESVGILPAVTAQAGLTPTLKARAIIVPALGGVGGLTHEDGLRYSLINDAFSSDATPVLLGVSDSGHTWHELLGAWRKQNGRAYCATPASSGLGIVVVSTGARPWLEMQFPVVSDLESLGLAFRVQDSRNFMFVARTGAGTAFARFADGVGVEEIIVGPTIDVGGSLRVESELDGTIRVYTDGVLRTTLVRIQLLQATAHGLAAYRPSGDAIARADNYSAVTK